MLLNHDIEINQGSTFALIVDVGENVESCSAKFSLRRSPLGRAFFETESINKSLDNQKLRVPIPSHATSQVPSSRYFYDLITDCDCVRGVQLAGGAVVRPGLSLATEFIYSPGYSHCDRIEWQIKDDSFCKDLHDVPEIEPRFCTDCNVCEGSDSLEFVIHGGGITSIHADIPAGHVRHFAKTQDGYVSDHNFRIETDQRKVEITHECYYTGSPCGKCQGDNCEEYEFPIVLTIKNCNGICTQESFVVNYRNKGKHEDFLRTLDRGYSYGSHLSTPFLRRF